MAGITFPSEFDGSDTDLAEILAVLPPSVRTLEWRASRWLEVIPRPGLADAVHELRALADADAAVPFDLIETVAESRCQVIDGELRAHRPDSEEPDLIIRSVRGDSWDMESSNLSLLAAAQTALPGCKPHPEPVI